ncbi:MAG: hypothetical protein ACRDP5_17715 [Streptosporangiaceae bacterium]
MGKRTAGQWMKTRSGMETVAGVILMAAGFITIAQWSATGTGWQSDQAGWGALLLAAGFGLWVLSGWHKRQGGRRR